MLDRQQLVAAGFTPFAQTVLVQFQPRKIPHHLESLAIAFAIFMLLSVAIFGFRVDSAAHEWGLFLKHLETATAAARNTALSVMAGIYLVLLAAVVVARRKKVKVV